MIGQGMTPFYIAAGGAMGSILRYYLSNYVNHLTKGYFPMGTLTVNILGSFLMGVLVGYMAKTLPHSNDLRSFLAIGILGGFTTFSAFSLDAVTLIERGNIYQAGIYVALSVFVSIVALFAGLHLTRNFL
jgi:CrcB protein